MEGKEFLHQILSKDIKIIGIYFLNYCKWRIYLAKETSPELVVVLTHVGI